MIGQARLLADDTVDGFVAANGPNTCTSAPPNPNAWPCLASHGASASAPAPGVLDVTGVSTDLVGDLAAAHGITIHELSLQQVTREEAFMELTHDSVEYRTDTVTIDPPPIAASSPMPSRRRPQPTRA